MLNKRQLLKWKKKIIIFLVQMKMDTTNKFDQYIVFVKDWSKFKNFYKKIIYIWNNNSKYNYFFRKKEITPITTYPDLILRL